MHEHEGAICKYAVFGLIGKSQCIGKKHIGPHLLNWASCCKRCTWVGYGGLLTSGQIWPAGWTQALGLGAGQRAVAAIVISEQRPGRRSRSSPELYGRRPERAEVRGRGGWVDPERGRWIQPAARSTGRAARSSTGYPWRWRTCEEEAER